MLDIHCHLLPGLDDGPETFEESLAMARLAAEDGITAIVATPHFVVERNCVDVRQVVCLAEKLNSILQEHSISLTVYPGMELRADISLPELYCRGKVLTLCETGKYVLVDFHPATMPLFLEQMVFQLMLKDVRVIIAHPERNRDISSKPALLFSMLRQGALIQLDAGSLTGEFGSEARKAAEQFLEMGWVSFIATDGHSAKWRKPVLLPAFKAVSKLIGEEQAIKLFYDNPEKVIKGITLTEQDIAPCKEEKYSFIKKLIKRSGERSRGSSRS